MKKPVLRINRMPALWGSINPAIAFILLGLAILSVFHPSLG